MAACPSFADALSIYNAVCSPHAAESAGDLSAQTGGGGAWVDALWDHVVEQLGVSDSAANANAQRYLEHFCGAFPLDNSLLTELAQSVFEVATEQADGVDLLPDASRQAQRMASAMATILEQHKDVRVRLAVAQVAGRSLRDVTRSCRAALDLAPAGSGSWLATHMRSGGGR